MSLNDYVYVNFEQPMNSYSQGIWRHLIEFSSVWLGEVYRALPLFLSISASLMFTSTLNSICSFHDFNECGDEIWWNLVKGIGQGRDRALPLSLFLSITVSLMFLNEQVNVKFEQPMFFSLYQGTCGQNLIEFVRDIGLG